MVDRHLEDTRGEGVHCQFEDQGDLQQLRARFSKVLSKLCVPEIDAEHDERFGMELDVTC